MIPLYEFLEELFRDGEEISVAQSEVKGQVLTTKDSILSEEVFMYPGDHDGHMNLCMCGNSELCTTNKKEPFKLKM